MPRNTIHKLRDPRRFLREAEERTKCSRRQRTYGILREEDMSHRTKKCERLLEVP